jgi:hypothetical protein
MKKAFIQSVKSIFMYSQKLDWPVLGLFVLINLLVLVNATLHHPKIGYDAVDHITYMQVLFDRLPDANDTLEFFSPPLPYYLPSIFDKACEIVLNDQQHIPLYQNSYYIHSCRFADGKFAQYINFLISIVTIYFILLICDYIKPSNRFYKISVLMQIALLTVYYRTFSQVRGEPYVALFIVIASYLLIRLFDAKKTSGKIVIALGLSLGALILSRQWGFFIFPAILLTGIWLLLQEYHRAVQLIKPVIVSLVLCAVLGGWFYIHLYVQNKTFTAFNIEQNQPMSPEQIWKVIRITRLKNSELFKKPIRPSFVGDINSIFYSDTWGDYWGFFTYIKDKSMYGEQGLGNSDEMGSYLGQVNLFSTVPTFLFVGGWLMAFVRLFRRKKTVFVDQFSSAFFFFLSFFTIVGFAFFIVNYYVLDDSTLKTSYILHFFIILTFLSADLLETIRSRSRFVYFSILFLFAVVFFHNLPAFVTRYIYFPWS